MDKPIPSPQRGLDWTRNGGRSWKRFDRPVASPLHLLPFPDGWWRDKKVRPLKRKLCAYLESQLAETSGLWGFKDPRTCRLLPLWWEVFEELQVTPSYVWAVRAPAEAAASMAIKNTAARPMTAAQAEVMWLAYNFDTLRYALAAHPFVVEYGEWFRDAVGTARRLMDGLSLPGYATESELADCVTNIVTREYRHEREGEGAATSVIPLAQNLFRDICHLSGGEALTERMSGYVAMLDIVFRTMTPYAELITEMPDLRRQVQEAKKLAAQHEAVLTGHNELRAAYASVCADKQTLTSSVAELERAVATGQEQARTAAKNASAVQQKLAEISADQEQTRAALAQSQGNLAAERDRASRLDLNTQSLLAEHAQAEKARRETIASLEAQLAVARKDLMLNAEALRTQAETSDRLQACEARCRELQLACDGYLARIGALEQEFPQKLSRLVKRWMVF